MEKKILADRAACTDIIIIDGRLVDKGWVQDNKNYICSGKIGQDIIIDVVKIGSPTAIAAWIKKYRFIINYGNSEPRILSTHKVDGEIRRPPALGSIPLDQLKNKVAAAGGDWDSDKYSHYVFVNFDIDNHLIIDVRTNYDIREYCFSIQLLKAVLNNSADLPQNPIFEFNKIVLNKKDAMIFWIQNSLNEQFFDFSDNPKEVKKGIKIWVKNPL